MLNAKSRARAVVVYGTVIIFQSASIQLYIFIKELPLSQRIDMKKAIYKQEVENKTGWTRWIHPKMEYQIKCCDCGLEHKIELGFRVKRLPKTKK